MLFNEDYIRHDKTVPKTFPPMQDKGSLRFDFLILPQAGIREKYYAIEYDGEQHFNNRTGSFGRFDYEVTQKRDRIKNFYAVQNRLNLLRIGYSVKHEFLAIVQKFFNDCNTSTSTDTLVRLEGAEYDDAYKIAMFPTNTVFF